MFWRLFHFKPFCCPICTLLFMLALSPTLKFRASVLLLNQHRYFSFLSSSSSSWFFLIIRTRWAMTMHAWYKSRMRESSEHRHLYSSAQRTASNNATCSTMVIITMAQFASQMCGKTGKTREIFTFTRCRAKWKRKWKILSCNNKCLGTWQQKHQKRQRPTRIAHYAKEKENERGSIKTSFYFTVHRNDHQVWCYVGRM